MTHKAAHMTSENTNVVNSVSLASNSAIGSKKQFSAVSDFNPVVSSEHYTTVVPNSIPTASFGHHNSDMPQHSVELVYIFMPYPSWQ